MAEARLDITDELLVAYVDDELEPAQRELVNAVLLTNPTARRRADEMRLSRDLLRQAFPLREDASVPASIEAAANRLAEACEQRCGLPLAEPASSSQFSSKARPSSSGRWKWALAAAVVLGVAVPATYLAWRAGVESSESPVTALLRIEPNTSLYKVLESTPSAEVINDPAEDAAIRAVLTFRAKDGRFCREFEILAGSGSSTGIACRAQGEWRAEVMLSAKAAPPESNYYTPAGESDEPALAEVADRLIEGDPLGAEEEARVLASSWAGASEASNTP